MIKSLFLLPLCCLIVAYQISEDSSGDQGLDFEDNSINSGDAIISAMKRKSKKYLEEIGERWITGEKFNERQIQCLLDKGKCGEELKIIKETLVSALQDGCLSCSIVNKRIAGDALLVLLSRQPEVWKRFTQLKFQDKYMKMKQLKDLIKNK